MNTTPERDGWIREGPLTDLGSSVEWFRESLAGKRLAIHSRSQLHLGLERLDTLREGALAGLTFKFPNRGAAFDFFSDAIGVDFLTKILHRGVTAGLTLDRSRWRHCISGDPVITRPGSVSSDRDRLWETVLACAAATFATAVEFEEPDVLCEFSAKRFGIAAKFAHSDKRLWRNVEKGLDQARTRVAAAVVAVNVIDLLPAADLFEESSRRTFNHPADVVDWLRGWATDWCERPELRTMADELKAAAPAVMGVAFFMPLLLSYNDHPLPFFYTHMPLTWSDGHPDFEFAKSFLRSCSTVLGFRGGAA